MLQSLHVKNLALMEENEVEFSPGFNVLTGETGAGKSLLIGSVTLALGGKFDSSLLRKGTDSGLVELVFTQLSPQTHQILQELELDTEEDTCIITRKFQTGKNTCRINGETVTAKQVKEVAETLLDIHGQHEHQSLLKKAKHLEILDAYSAGELEQLLPQLKEAYRAWKEKKEELEGEALDNGQQDREKALAEFELKEILEAKLSTGEDENLEREYRKMVNSQKILEGLGESYQATGGEDAGAGAQIGHALRLLRGIAGYDEALCGLEEQLQEIDGLLSDYNREVSSYLSDADFDPAYFSQVETRLNQINHLKDKYGRTIEEVLAYGDSRQQLLDKLSDYDAYLARLQVQVEKAYENLCNLCDKVSVIRKENAILLEKTLKLSLEELNFLSVDFTIAVKQNQEITSKGYDDVEFLISTNPGEPVKPLGQVASGGELSRVMLAIKTVLAGKDSIDTLIFDEIDTGISGKTAWKVAGQIGILGKEHQVLCITHLPQIAAMADGHFVIEKTSDGDSTTTVVRKLEEEESLQELARLLGSDELSEAALSNARALKAQALENRGA